MINVLILNKPSGKYLLIFVGNTRSQTVRIPTGGWECGGGGEGGRGTFRKNHLQ